MRYRNAVRLLIGAATLAATAFPASLSAQELRGTVVESNDTTRVSGAVVLLLHATKDSIFTRIITGERGTFSLSAPAATPVRLRVLRIGYQATNAGPYTLAIGQTESVRIKLSDQRVVLATFDVASTKRCEVRPDSALLVAQLYEEARKALLASATVVSGVRHQAQFVLFNRIQDERKKLRAPIKRNTFAGPTFKPFASVSADALAKSGFVVEQSDGFMYHAPDAELLLSDLFLRSHCLQLVNGTGERAASIGIGFRPTEESVGRRMVDVKGTLWLDRSSNELQYLDYEYVGIPDALTREGVGGRVEYTQMSGGFWFVGKWAIRTPSYKPGATFGPGASGSMTAVNLAGLEIGGGEVQWIKADDQTIYSNPGAVLAGAEPSDVHFTIGVKGSIEASAGTEVANATSVSRTDTIFSSSDCQAVSTEGYTGQVRGSVRDGARGKNDSTMVIAEWKEDFRVSGKQDFVWQVRTLRTKANADGGYVFCGLPIARPISLSATSEGRKSRAALVRLTEKEQRTVMDLAVGEPVAGKGAGEGRTRGIEVLVTDPFGVPIAFANVNVGGGNRVADKDGRVFLTIAPRDSIRIQARRIGYAAFDKTVGRDSANAPFHATLAPIIQKLGTVTINDRITKSSLELTGFYDRIEAVHRGAFRAEFFTPEDLIARPSSTLTQFLAASRFVQIGRDAGGTFVQGRTSCPMAIVVDGMQIDVYNPRKLRGDARIPDVNAVVSMSEISAIEVYPSVANAPPSISSRVTDGNCGVIAIWTGGRTAK